MIKTLIVDDSPLARTIIRDFFDSDGSFQIIGEAENGLEGLNLAIKLKPDLITMDIEMPEMNGLEAIGEIKKNITTPIVVISTHDTAKMAFDATIRGAMEFYPKDIFSTQMTEMRRDQILNTLKHITHIDRRVQVNPDTDPVPISGAGLINVQVIPRQIGCVVIAASTGGPKALSQLCTDLPKDFPVPVVLVQHNSSGFDRGFVQWLNGYTPLNVCLAEERHIPSRGNLYVAPTDKHLLLTEAGFLLGDGAPVNNQKPAADLLFKSAAELHGKSLVSVVLTGMGRDGAEGTRYVKGAGGITIAQDEASSMIYGMPRTAVETGCVNMVLPLGTIANQLIHLTKGSDKA
jgi:two-component system chemotaxis response regulator CheB